MEELTGKAITQLDLQNISMKDLRAIVFAGLCHEDSTLSPKSVGELIDDYSNIETVAEKLGEAFTLAFGESEKGGNNQKN